MQVLVIGGSGFLGRELLRQVDFRGDTAIGTYARSSPEPSSNVEWRHLNVADRANVAALVSRLRPDVVVNAASVPSDWRVTADGAANVALAAQPCGTRLVQVSSDAVFSGRSSPYPESATPDPVTPYGAAKGAAETAVAAITPYAAIARTSLIIGDNGASKHEQRARDAAQGGPGLFVDDVRCPVHVADLATALLTLSGRADASGIFHLAGPQAVSRFELGRLIAVRDGLDPGSIQTRSKAEEPNATSSDIRLDCRRSYLSLGVALRSATDFLTPA